MTTPDPTTQTAYTKSKHRGALHATATGVSIAIAPFVPLTIIPAAVTGYKAYKHHKTKRLLESQHPELTQTQTSDVEKFNANVRQVMRHLSRGFIGFSFTSVMVPVLPHMVLPAGLNVYILHRAEKERKELARQMHEKGFQVRKRDVARGVGRVVIEKAILIPMTLGHDDLLLAFPATALNDFGILHGELVDVSGIHELNDALNAPVEEIQEALGIQTADDRLEAVQHYDPDTGGWHESPAALTSNVAIGGTVAAGVEWVVDRPLEYRDGKLQKMSSDEKMSGAVEKKP